MRIIDVRQGSTEWLVHRAQHRNASDAPAMMGFSPYKTRAQLLAEFYSGTVPEVDAATQKRFDDGHRFEALYRPIAEKIIGDDLYPVTGVEDGSLLSASFDGLTMLFTEAYEHKTLNEALRAAFADIETINPEFREKAAGKCLPMVYRIQAEQQCMVSGCERVLFAATRWDEQDKLVEEKWCWYYPDPALAAQIRAGWAQFQVDLDTYLPPAAAAPAPVGKAPEALPALRIEVTGAVTASNLAEFKATALEAIRSVNRELKTDEDFANADKAVKWCSDVESRLEAAKQHALSQTSTIDELFRTMDEIKAEARQVRLDLDKLVKARKDSVRGEIVAGAQLELDKHVAALNIRMGTAWIQRRIGGFGDAIKGLKTVKSVQAAADQALANEKIATSALADLLERNRKALLVAETDYLFLFADFAAVGQKPAEDFAAIAGQRIQQHQAREAEVKRQAEAAAAAAAAAKLQREQDERAAVAAPPPAAAPAQAAVVRAPLPAPAAAAKPDTRPPITTGQLCERLPFTMQVEQVQQLGVQPLPKQPGQRGMLWAEADYPKILAALIDRLQDLYEQAVQ